MAKNSWPKHVQEETIKTNIVQQVGIKIYVCELVC
jgi:hypothetical protein